MGIGLAVFAGDRPPPGMVLIPAGNYVPLYRAALDPEKIPLTAFLLDEQPVTNAGFLEFVRAHPKWRRSQVSPLFADSSYLEHWAGDLEPGPRAPLDAPVVRVSWFAARACAARNVSSRSTSSTRASSYSFTGGRRRRPIRRPFGRVRSCSPRKRRISAGVQPRSLRS